MSFLLMSLATRLGSFASIAGHGSTLSVSAGIAARSSSDAQMPFASVGVGGIGLVSHASSVPWIATPSSPPSLSTDTMTVTSDSPHLLGLQRAASQAWNDCH